MIRILLIICAVAYPSFAYAGKHCILPVPDGGDTTPNPANIVGSITAVEPQAITVREHGDSSVSIHYSSHTQLVTLFGGISSAKDFHKGQTVKVWLKDCERPKKGPIRAAYIETQN